MYKILADFLKNESIYRFGIYTNDSSLSELFIVYRTGVN